MSAAPVLILSIQGEPADCFGGHRECSFDCRDGSIGRSDDCDWVLHAEGVSRLHAMVRFLNGLYFIEDRSTNGMVLNDAPLRKGDPVALKHGDRLRIDSFELSVRLGGEAATQTVSEARQPAHADTRAPVFPMTGNLEDIDFAPVARPSGSAGDVGHAEGLIPGAEAVLPGVGLDPLALFDTSSSHLDEPVRFVPPAPCWNHSPAVADQFRPPQRESVRADGPMLPEDWDATHSQAAAARTNAQPESPAGSVPPAGEARDAAVADGLIEIAPATASPPVQDAKAVEAVEVAGADLTEMFHIAVDAMMDVLRARAELKNSFRLPATLIQRSENNPLKFAPTAQEAVRKLLEPPGNGFLAGSAALGDAADDIRNHQMAMLAGVRSAFASMLAQFDPERVEEEVGQTGRRFPFSVQSRHWERYKARFAELTRNPDECFRRLFGDEFARAYEEQLGRLKSRRN
jgi:type VI secretion system protein ImpI